VALGGMISSSVMLVSSAVLVSSAIAEEAPAGGEKQLPPLQLSIDRNEVDLEQQSLTVRMSRAASRVTLKVIGVSGAMLAEVAQAFDAAPAGSPLVVRWSSDEAEAVARVEVFGHDVNGYYAGIAITPWSFEIPHEDVAFETDSAEVRPSEVGKLRASLALIKKELPRAGQLGAVTLFILAHTDTVGSSDYNLRLSTRRAQSIASWFRKQGLKIPMAYDGMGEKSLKLKTADEVAEPSNRRVDYMLSIEPPRFKLSGASPIWKRL
jgi:outer membrane protein OmpA-like peptidoglycan-associated protein